MQRAELEGQSVGAGECAAEEGIGIFEKHCIGVGKPWGVVAKVGVQGEEVDDTIYAFVGCV